MHSFPLVYSGLLQRIMLHSKLFCISWYSLCCIKLLALPPFVLHLLWLGLVVCNRICSLAFCRSSLVGEVSRRLVVSESTQNASFLHFKGFPSLGLENRCRDDVETHDPLRTTHTHTIEIQKLHTRVISAESVRDTTNVTNLPVNMKSREISGKSLCKLFPENVVIMCVLEFQWSQNFSLVPLSLTTDSTSELIHLWHHSSSCWLQKGTH